MKFNDVVSGAFLSDQLASDLLGRRSRRLPMRRSNGRTACEDGRTNQCAPFNSQVEFEVRERAIEIENCLTPFAEKSCRKFRFATSSC
jgi:hypothetical protein